MLRQARSCPTDSEDGDIPQSKDNENHDKNRGFSTGLSEQEEYSNVLAEEKDLPDTTVKLLSSAIELASSYSIVDGRLPPFSDNMYKPDGLSDAESVGSDFPSTPRELLYGAGPAAVGVNSPRITSMSGSSYESDRRPLSNYSTRQGDH